MEKSNKDEIFYLNFNDENFKIKLINIFLQNQNAIVTLGDNKFITCDSFIGYVTNYNDYMNAILDENAVLIDTDLFSNQLKSEIFTEDYNNKENLSPGTILKNGICRLSDSDNDFCYLNRRKRKISFHGIR